jgi:uncharacterized membrane protein
MADRRQRSRPLLADFRQADVYDRGLFRSPPRANGAAMQSGRTELGQSGHRSARTFQWRASAPSAVFVLAANVLALGNFRVPFVGPALGFWFLIIHPTYLIFASRVFARARPAERVGYSVTGVLLALMLCGLVVNTVLPWLGVQHPLATAPVVIVGDGINIACYAIRRRWPDRLSWRSLGPVPAYEARLVGAGLACLALAVLGANRLDNGAGNAVSIVALTSVIVTALFLLLWTRRVRDGAVCMTLYLLSLTILLMTSLRGSYVTGHDIKTEYRVFQLTAVSGKWNLSTFHSAYNACLSLTILPTEIERVVNVYDPYIFKFFFQALFALCPVLLYAICQRYWPRSLSTIAVLYFVGFPTFVNDMPFLNRQEMAFLFVCAGVLALTNYQWPQAWRRVVLFAAALGIELSHYSTMYVFLGALATAWLLGSAVSLHRTVRGRRHGYRDGTRHGRSQIPRPSPTVGLGSVLYVAAALVLWGGLATHTAGPLLTDLESAVQQFAHPMSATPYSLFSRASPSPEQVFRNFQDAASLSNIGNPSLYIPISAVNEYPAHLVTEPLLPVTAVGHLLSSVKLSAASLTSDWRQGLAKDEQLFVVVGFAVIALGSRLRRSVSAEFIYLGIGSVAVVGLFTVFPALAGDYGTLRAFQEALLLIAPVLALGTASIFLPFGRSWSVRLAGVVCIAALFSTTGLMPELLGGYPAQLNLNNNGQYYDIYYTHAQDIAAVDWLNGKPDLMTDGVQAPLDFNLPYIANYMSPGNVTDIYPATIRQSSWVVLSYAIVHTRRAVAPVTASAYILLYSFPLSVLQGTKNLVYNNGGSEIYK